MKITLVILIVLEIVLAALALPPKRATYHYYTTKEVHRGPDQPPEIEKIGEGSGEIGPIRAAPGFWVLLTINTALLVAASVRF